jgi:hypothetical protein
MYSPKTATATFGQPAGSVLETVKRLASQKPYTTTAVDEAAGTIAFEQGKTALSWGTEFEVRVTSAGSGTEVSVTAGGKDGAPRAMLDGMKHNKAAKRFVSELSGALGA